MKSNMILALCLINSNHGIHGTHGIGVSLPCVPCIPWFIPFAVHIPDGNVLTPGWLVAGYLLAGILVGMSAWRIQDEEIPRVALLTAAFFVASLLHVPVPGLPSSAHLLLNGLLGVVLGRRAPLAIGMGLLLQAILLQHGGLTTLGVNCCVMALPALLAWQLFAILQPKSESRNPNLCDPQRPLRLVEEEETAEDAENRRGKFGFRISSFRFTKEFALGLLVGAVAVLATVLLHCLTLVWGGTSDWRALVVLVLPPHLFIAAIEGVVLGFTVSFLARVKPELLNGQIARTKNQIPRTMKETATTIAIEQEPRTKFQEAKLQNGLVLGIWFLVLWPSSAWAHRLEAEAQTKKIQKVKIESWFDLGGVPAGARVQVFRKSDKQLLLEHTLDENGRFTFFADNEPLHIVISAGDGHEKEIDIQPEADVTSLLPPADRSTRVGIKDILVGIGFLLALSAFVLSVRNNRRLASLSHKAQ
jgi:cobalt/nickel transport system permease protein